MLHIVDNIVVLDYLFGDFKIRLQKRLGRFRH